MKLPMYQELKAIMQRLGYAWFEGSFYNLNIVGIRTADTAANTFNDWVGVAFITERSEHLFWFPATTDPGTYWRENPMHTDGTAVVCAGQYRGLWQIGKHQGRYDALVQRKPITVFRDNNRDSMVDLSGDQHQGFFGINMHRATENGHSKQVSRWSAGCQVLASSADFDLLMSLCRQARDRYGNAFTYTLLEEDQLWSH